MLQPTWEKGKKSLCGTLTLSYGNTSKLCGQYKVASNFCIKIRTRLNIYVSPGNRPPSARPRNTRVKTSPVKLCMNAEDIVTAPNATTRIASHVDPNCFNARFDGISAAMNCRTYYFLVGNSQPTTYSYEEHCKGYIVLKTFEAKVFFKPCNER